jgi:hypothetical protein
MSTDTVAAMASYLVICDPLSTTGLETVQKMWAFSHFTGTEEVDRLHSRVVFEVDDDVEEDEARRAISSMFEISSIVASRIIRQS